MSEQAKLETTARRHDLAAVLLLAWGILISTCGAVEFFKYCTPQRASETLNVFCEKTREGCRGQCVTVRVIGRYECENSWNPICEGLSYALVTETVVGCEDDGSGGCVCGRHVVDYREWWMRNGCD